MTDDIDILSDRSDVYLEVNNEVIEVLDYLCAKIGVSVDWSSKNVLPYAKQLSEKFINWKIASSIFWFVIGLVLCIVAIALTAKAISIYKTDMQEHEYIYRDGEFGGCVFGAIGFALFGIPMILFNIYEIVLCNVFPEMALYNLISDMLK